MMARKVMAGRATLRVRSRSGSGGAAAGGAAASVAAVGRTVLLASLSCYSTSSLAFSPQAPVSSAPGSRSSSSSSRSGSSRSSSSSTGTTGSPVTPDFTTGVDVANIRLTKPKGPPGRGKTQTQQPKWEGLVGLDQRTEGSLIQDTLTEMEGDEDFKTTAARLKELGQKKMTQEERKLRRRSLQDMGHTDFKEFLKQQKLSIPRAPSTILQLNIGLYCNQACNHCHVESSPKRTEMMSREVAEQAIEVLRRSKHITTLDITGGAPEMNAQFRYLVDAVAALRKEQPDREIEIIDRCNLTVLLEPGQEDLAQYLADNKVHVVASLPCYSAKNVNMQRGRGVFDRSIAGLRQLNAQGYGEEGSGLALDLVYNPIGAFLPPPQEALQIKYKEELWEEFGVSFNNLFTITNMPIKRFADFLYRRGELSEYMDLLVRNFNPAAAKGVMCTDTISVGWDGRLYDCDFNQQLALGMGTQGTAKGTTKDGTLMRPASKDGFTIFELGKGRAEDLAQTEIVFESHCFGCTSGMGSSCQGATA